MPKELSKTADLLYNKHFEAYKSNVCHFLKSSGDFEFIKIILTDDTIAQLSENGHMAEALYLLAMLDYVSKENDIPICTKYNTLRHTKLKELAVPEGIRISLNIFHDRTAFDNAYKKAIPEFLKYNIMEGDVRNVC